MAKKNRPRKRTPRRAGILPPDPGLPDLNRLLQPDWMRRAFRQLFGEEHDEPDRIRPRRLAYRPGKRALVGYVAERTHEDWIIEDEFACEAIAGKEGARAFRYPTDPYLPGLARAASPVEAQTLLSQYVSLHPEELEVNLVRYRPSTRAVLRYSASVRRVSRNVKLFVRVMRPNTMPRFLSAGKLVAQSEFVVPSLAGCWEEGGVVWLGRLPGKTVREHISHGTGPDPDAVLDCLSSIWALKTPQTRYVPELHLDATAEYLAHLLQGRPSLNTVAAIATELEPLIDSWQPAATAHNDFYDDQMILLPSGELALADFEEAGAGDSMMDVANFLAHLRWSGHFGRAPHLAAYATRLRAASLARFGWSQEELGLREAFALFRLSTNPVRRLTADWPDVTEDALGLVEAALRDAHPLAAAG